jgi:hypothetical protein
MSCVDVYKEFVKLGNTPFYWSLYYLTNLFQSKPINDLDTLQNFLKGGGEGIGKLERYIQNNHANISGNYLKKDTIANIMFYALQPKEWSKYLPLVERYLEECKILSESKK